MERAKERLQRKEEERLEAIKTREKERKQRYEREKEER